jgi:hypothetical protein
MLYALCSMLYALSSMLHAACSMVHGAWSIMSMINSLVPADDSPSLTARVSLTARRELVEPLLEPCGHTTPAKGSSEGERV